MKHKRCSDVIHDSSSALQLPHKIAEHGFEFMPDKVRPKVQKSFIMQQNHTIFWPLWVDNPLVTTRSLRATPILRNEGVIRRWHRPDRPRLIIGLLQSTAHELQRPTSWVPSWTAVYEPNHPTETPNFLYKGALLLLDFVNSRMRNIGWRGRSI